MSHVHLLLISVMIWASWAPVPLRAQSRAVAASPAESWACTAIPDRFWLPLSVLKERLQHQGYTVIEALATRDDCYTIRLHGKDMVEKTMIFDPVSAKPL